MKWIVVILIVLAALLAVALVLVALKRKKDQAGRERASELRSDAAANAQANPVHESRVREVQAEADRVRAKADQLEEHAKVERTAYDMSHAQQEDAVREADRLDPDVNHRAADYQPEVGHETTHQTGAVDAQPVDRGDDRGVQDDRRTERH